MEDRQFLCGDPVAGADGTGDGCPPLTGTLELRNTEAFADLLRVAAVRLSPDWEEASDDVGLALVDAEEGYVLVAERIAAGWRPSLHGRRGDGTTGETFPPFMVDLIAAGPYPTPGRCLWAPAGHLAEAVVAELFGVKT